MPEDLVWYVGYGSNTLPDRMIAYLRGSDPGGRFGFHRRAADASPPRRRRPVWLDHRLYFAGESERWRGGVAFVGLQAESVRTCGLAHLVTSSQFAHLIAGENGMSEVPWGASVSDIPLGAWAPVPVFTGGRPAHAKYNAVLRLPDIDGVPAATLTTWRNLGHRDPDPDYLAVIEAGYHSTGLLEPPAAREILRRAIAASRRSPGRSVAPESYHRAHPLVVDLAVDTGPSTGDPAVHVPESYSELQPAGGAPMTGSVALPDGGSIPVRVLPTVLPGRTPWIDAESSRALMRSGAPAERVGLAIPLPAGSR